MKAAGFALVFALALATTVPRVAGAQDELDAWVRIAPPPAQAEVRPSQPSPAHVWISGHWGRNAVINSYQWQPGFWQISPPGLTWQPAQWARFRYGWRFVPGIWRSAGAPPATPVVPV